MRKRFSMSMYMTATDLYKDKAEYFQFELDKALAMLSALMEEGVISFELKDTVEEFLEEHGYENDV